MQISPIKNLAKKRKSPPKKFTIKFITPKTQNTLTRQTRRIKKFILCKDQKFTLFYIFMTNIKGS